MSGARFCAARIHPSIPPKGKPASSCYRHKEGRCTCTGDRGSRRLLPESWGCSGRALWEVHCGVWRWAWQSSWSSFLEIVPASWRLQRAAWRCSEGPAGQGLVLVKAGAASESRAHAVRGLRGRESTKEAWGVGSIVAGVVPSTSCTASQVPTVPPQRRGAVTGVGGRDSGCCCCAERWTDAV